jgi:hypothetical protein
MDACFRLKWRLVSSELKDPALGSGWAYTVETGPYRKYLLTVTDQKEVGEIGFIWERNIDKVADEYL